MLGDASTSGSGVVTHTFTSGKPSLPSLTLETGLPDIPAWFVASGVMVNSLQVGFARSGAANATVGLIAQGEVRQTQSNPGDIHTQQYFLALTWGRHGQTQITARHGWGREGWQSLGDARSIVDFASRQSTLSIQHWVEKNWGWRLVADQYRNDQYHREGLNLVLFREWR